MYYLEIVKINYYIHKMNLRLLLTVFLFQIFSPNVLGQKNAKVPDSLLEKTYSELAYVMYKLDSTTTKTFRVYAHAYFKKAKEDTSTINLLKAYRNLSYLGCLEKTEDEILYLDTIIDVTKSFKVERYPEYAYFMKGAIYYDGRDFKQSFDNYLTAYNLSKKKGELELMYKANYGIGVLKDRIGEYEESLRIFEECLRYLDNDKNFNNTEDYLAILSGLTDLYRKNKKIDSSSRINKIGIKKSLLNDNKRYYGYFVLSEGMNLFETNQYYKSIDSLEKSLTLLNEADDKPNSAFANFYLAKNFIKLNKPDKATYNLKKVDTVFLNTKDLNPDIRETYEILIDYYNRKNNKDQELLYVKRLMRLDSILTANYKYLSKNLNQKYDTPRLISQKEKLIKEMKNEKNKLNSLFIVVLIISTLIVTLLLFKARRKKIYKTKFENLLKTVKEPENSTTRTKSSKSTDIPKEISSKILSNLKRFETQQGYLNPNISMTNLAKQLDTNTKYLSKIINSHYEKSFSNYINDARIDFIITELKNNQKTRKYTIKAISEKAGFKNSQSFSQSFYKKTGIYPSFFIKNISKESYSKASE